MEFIHKYETTIRLGVFLGSFCLLAFLEWLNPRRLLTQKKIGRWLNNFSLVVLGAIAIRLIFPVAAVGTAYLIQQNHFGLIHYFDPPYWLAVVVSIVLLDLSVYFQHVIFHIMPILWRFHRVHHSDLDCDVSTGIRFHPIEIILSMVIKIVFIIMLGVPVLAVIIFEVVLNLMSMFTHSNIRINKRLDSVLRWFLVTPDMHRIHHSARENETNSNFCFHLSIWDRLFGTYLKEPKNGHDKMVIGLDQFRENNWQNLGGLLYLPFASQIGGYAVNYRDTVNADELELARELAIKNREKAELASELASYIEAIGKHALVSITDRNGKIIEVNDKFCEVSGYGRDELVGQDHSIVRSGIHDRDFFRRMWQQISSGEPWHEEVCNRNKQGELYWVDSAIVPILNNDGNIDRYISIRIDITSRKNREMELQQAHRELADANKTLEEMSRQDGLTGLANRRHFDEVLIREINRTSRSGDWLTLIICDIDNFKLYNDHYGHLLGDSCLRLVAASIQTTFSRNTDLVARYGGEEFAIILPLTDQVAAIKLAEKMRREVNNLNIEHAASINCNNITISAGFISLIPDDKTTAEMLIDKADKALYLAKEKGKNRIHLGQ